MTLVGYRAHRSHSDPHVLLSSPGSGKASGDWSRSRMRGMLATVLKRLLLSIAVRLGSCRLGFRLGQGGENHTFPRWDAA